jgi:hypothetical protein
MTTRTTVFGVATRIGSIAEERSATGRVMGGHSYDDLSPELPDDGVAVDLDHNGKSAAGSSTARSPTTAAYSASSYSTGPRSAVSSKTSTSRLSCSCSVPASTNAATSPAKAQLLGLALTLNPATLGAWPADWMPGDVRRSPDRGS